MRPAGHDGRVTNSARAASVLVVGSVNQDITVRVPRFPAPGETLLGDEVVYGLGGKGANQAVAAARTGVPTALLARVGEDPAGQRLRSWLEERGVDTALVTATDRPSGTAHILVDAAGENQIVVVPGANAATDAAFIRGHADMVAAAGIVVIQAEIPLVAVEVALSLNQNCVLNLAPAAPIADAVLAHLRLLVVNESEAAVVLGAQAPQSVDDAMAAVVALSGKCRGAVITLGARGAVWAAAAESGYVAASSVRAVDTTGAGDAFVGVLAASLVSGRTLERAVGDGVRAATASVQHPGAAMSYPPFTLTNG